MNKRFKTLEITLCALFTALTAVGAFIQIPVPGMDYFTLQFFFVLMAGILLGSRLGGVAVGTYVLLGLAGLPIFAAGGGITYVTRPSFGYLIGFVCAAYLVGKVVEILDAKTFAKFLMAGFCGFVVCYAIGLVYKYFMLNLYIGQKTPIFIVFLDCFPLDMPGDVVLTFISAYCGKRLRPYVQNLIRETV